MKFIPGINNQCDEYETKQQPEESEKDPNDSHETDERTTLEILRNIELPLALLDGLFTIQEAIEEYILPRPETEEDTLKIVKRLEDWIRPKMYDVSQYKTTEDAISRALFDMLGSTSDSRKSSASFSELQKLLWLERARHLDGDIILLMEGLLGQPVAGADLMKNIKENFKCNVTKILDKVNRYNDLIESGLMAFNHFAVLGQMSVVEVSRRKSAVKQRNARVMARNAALIQECF
uniref:Uncharacterized protein n=1 Tax=Daphnia galeata TaxID=27404 RepID=A0A8J2WE96_9CRUS|nr:unnamed protein product [Daphnia galeata]